MKVDIYWNIRKKCYSVRHKGKVIDRGEDFALRNVTCVVQQAGRDRVLREGRKNVHAFLRGDLIPLSTCSIKVSEAKNLRYNPYTTKMWQCEGKDVTFADECWVTTTNKRPQVVGRGVR